MFAQPDHNHKRSWENSRQLCKPETKTRVYITVSNSPNPSSVYMRICKHRKKVFYYFYKITFPKKNAKLFVMALIKGEILTSHKVLYTKSCTRNQFRILLKDAFQNTAFSRLKCQLKRKKLTWLVCKDFPSFNRRWNG